MCPYKSMCVLTTPRLLLPGSLHTKEECFLLLKLNTRFYKTSMRRNALLLFLHPSFFPCYVKHYKTSMRRNVLKLIIQSSPFMDLFYLLIFLEAKPCIMGPKQNNCMFNLYGKVKYMFLFSLYGKAIVAMLSSLKMEIKHLLMSLTSLHIKPFLNDNFINNMDNGLNMVYSSCRLFANNYVIKATPRHQPFIL